MVDPPVLNQMMKKFVIKISLKTVFVSSYSFMLAADKTLKMKNIPVSCT